MEIKEFLERLGGGQRVEAGSDMHKMMCRLSDEAMRITCELNGSYHTPDQIRALFSTLTGKQIDESFMMFPPFYTDFGRNITVGKNVFINACCNFQDQGGITIGDGSQIGHKVILATLDHGTAAHDRGSLYPAPIIIGKNVWVGSGVTILRGVTIGDNAIVAAGAVVTKDVDENTVVAGVPARVVRVLVDC